MLTRELERTCKAPGGVNGVTVGGVGLAGDYRATAVHLRVDAAQAVLEHVNPVAGGVMHRVNPAWAVQITLGGGGDDLREGGLGIQQVAGQGAAHSLGDAVAVVGVGDYIIRALPKLQKQLFHATCHL